MPSGTYTTPTLQDALTALSTRLMDPGFARWTPAELTRYLAEALRTWNAYTQGTRDQGVFSTTSTVPFYDLGAKLPTLRGLTVTDRDVITDLEYSLLEPATPTGWTGSQQFTLDDLTQAVQRRRDQFLQETGALLTRSAEPISPAPQGRIPLPETVLTIRRVAWRSATNLITPVLRSDDWALANYGPRWLQSPVQPPQVYTTSVTPPLVLQMAPPPLDTGELDLLTVHKGAALDPATVATVLGVPDDWSWVIKFGALADLLSRDGLALDPARAAYAEARWTQGVDAAAAASVVLAARINNVACLLASVSEADTYSPLWQSVPGTPARVLTAGQNLIALWPPPGVPVGGGDWSVTLDVVRNMPVPVALGEALQIGADAYDVLLDYAQHLALFKEGGVQLQTAQPLLDRFLRFCGVTLSLQQASQPARRPLLAQTGQDESALARQLPPELVH